MKKRLLSLVLCLVMVFSLFPMGVLASTKENVGTDGDYVYVPTEKAWTTSDDFSSTEYYVKDGDNYYRVTPQQVSSQPYYTTDTLTLKAGDTLQAGKYFVLDGNEFREVRGENGYLYEAAATEKNIKKQDHAFGDSSTWEGYCMEHFFSKYMRVAGTTDTYKYAWGWPNESNLFYYDAGQNAVHFLYYNTLASGGFGSAFNAHYETTLFYYTDAASPYNEPATIPSESNGYAATSIFDDGTYSNGNMSGTSKDSNQKYTEAKSQISYLKSSDYRLFAHDTVGNSEFTKDTSFWWQGGKWLGNMTHWYSNGLVASKITLYNRMPNQGLRTIYYLDGNNEKQEIAHSPIYQNEICKDRSFYVVDSTRHASALTYTKDGQTCVVPGSSYLRYAGETTYYTGVLYTKEKLGTLGGHKDISGNPGDGYTLTIDSWATGNYQKFVDGEAQPVDPPAKTPLDIVLVVDQSGSMRTQDLEGGEIQYNSTNKTEWTVADLRDGTQYYYKVGDKYYPVQLGRGTVYRHYGDVRGDWTFGWGNDGISLMVNGAPTYYNVRTFYYVYVDADGDHVPEMHRLRAITAGLDLHYGFYPYIYKDENNEYAQMGKWTDNHYWFRLISPWGANKLRGNARWNTIVAGGNNDDAALISFLDTDEKLLGATDAACNKAKMNYSWVTSTAKMKDLYVANGRDYANLYYVDDNGVRQNISTRYFSTDNFNTKTPLYTISGGSSRVSALESAVSQFVDAVKAQGADDQIAIVGYAQNSSETTVPSGVKYVGRNSGSYVNTGVFTGNDFSGFNNYDNASYSNVLQNVSDVNFSAGTFGTWGGTYTNYGMAMANQISSGRENAKKVVIFFTDGEPGELGYEHTVAGETLINGANVKANADVYTVGLYPQSASAEVKTFLKNLSSEYKTEVDSVLVSDMDPDKTYFVKQGDQYVAISTDYYGESSLGWWEHNADGTYTLMNVKGANAGAGEEYLYTGKDGQGETTGENADTSKTYYSSRNNEVKYGYHWFDAQMNDIVPSGYVYTLTNTRQVGSYAMTTSTKPGLEQIFTDLAATIRPTNADSQQTVMPGATGTATNYDKGNSYVQDVISSDFDLGSNYTVTVREVTGVTAYDNEQAAQGSEGTILVSGNGPTATNGDYSYEITGKTIKVTGWDFGAGYAANKALRVTITGLVPTVTGTVYSNDPARSGIYNTAGERLFPYNNPSIVIPTYTVQWSVNGQVVETDADLPYNSVPSYDGEAPEKAADDGNTYVFVGWSAESANDVAGAKPVYELPNVTAPVTYYAVFRAIPVKTYTVHWMNNVDADNGPELLETSVKSGVAPAYQAAPGEDPVQEPVKEGAIFVGWSTNKDYVFSEETADQNLYFGNKTVDELNPDANNNVYLYAIFVDEQQIPVEQHYQAVVLEYNTIHEIAQDVYDFLPTGELSGKFALNEGSFTFTPGAVVDKEIIDRYDFTAARYVSSAVYYNANESGKITDATTVDVVPGSSIYYDDDLAGKNATSDAQIAATYNANLDVKTEELDPETGTRPLYFTFTGTGIEIYSSTLTDGDYIQAALFRLSEDGNSQTIVKCDENGNPAASGGLSARMIKVSSAVNRYNVPAVSFTKLPYGTYKVKLNIHATSNYVLDGVRIYGAVADKDQDNVYKDTAASEKNATYTTLRKMLLTDKVTLTGGAGYFTTDLKAEYVIKDEQGKETKITPATRDAYEKDGPKNEIYLEPGHGIAFTITNYDKLVEDGDVPQIEVGLKAPNEGKTSGNVLLSNGDNDPKSETVGTALEMYYTVTPKVDTDGNTAHIMIASDPKNKAGVLISVTKLKVSGTSSKIDVVVAADSSAKVASVSSETTETPVKEMRIALNQKTLEYAETFMSETTAASQPDTPAQPDDPTPGGNNGMDAMRAMLKQLFESLLKNLFDLFKGLGNW